MVVVARSRSDEKKFVRLQKDDQFFSCAHHQLVDHPSQVLTASYTDLSELTQEPSKPKVSLFGRSNE